MRVPLNPLDLEYLIQGKQVSTLLLILVVPLSVIALTVLICTCVVAEGAFTADLTAFELMMAAFTFCICNNNDMDQV